jgi:hypothetical protein
VWFPEGNQFLEKLGQPPIKVALHLVVFRFRNGARRGLLGHTNSCLKVALHSPIEFAELPKIKNPTSI